MKFNCKSEDIFKTIWENIQKTTFIVINYFKSLSLPSSKCHLFVYLVGRNTLPKWVLLAKSWWSNISLLHEFYLFFKRDEYNAASLLLRHFANDPVLQLSVLMQPISVILSNHLKIGGALPCQSELTRTCKSVKREHWHTNLATIQKRRRHWPILG